LLPPRDSNPDMLLQRQPEEMSRALDGYMAFTLILSDTVRVCPHATSREALASKGVRPEEPEQGWRFAAVER
jgi:hypothetical protein